MGHGPDDGLADLKERLQIRGDECDADLLAALRAGATRVELLTGRSFAQQEMRLRVDSGGLPFVALPDIRLDASSSVGTWVPLSDPVHPDLATVVELPWRRVPPAQAAPTALALHEAGQWVARWRADGRFEQSVAEWLARARAEDVRTWTRTPSSSGLARARAEDVGHELEQRLLDPHWYLQVPVGAAAFDGWWIQLSRRVRILNPDSPADQRLLEPLTPPIEGMFLAADEPCLIVARLTEEPVRWALTARVWMVEAWPHPRSWRRRGFADTIHRRGLPILSIDDDTTPAEAAAHLLLAAYWHGYLAGNEPEIPDALIGAFPAAVTRIARGTRVPDTRAAAGLLLARLVRPGFDPRRGAAAMRHYVRRHATTIVREQRSLMGGGHPWEALGISERYYYRLRGRLAGLGTEAHDDAKLTDEVLRQYLEARAAERARRRAALELLRGRGFSDAAARKWLQRHDLAEIRTAQPQTAARVGPWVAAEAKEERRAEDDRRGLRGSSRSADSDG